MWPAAHAQGALARMAVSRTSHISDYELIFGILLTAFTPTPFPIPRKEAERNQKSVLFLDLVDLVVIFNFLAKNGGAGACWGAPPPWTPR